jgi:hypothetical protein
MTACTFSTNSESIAIVEQSSHSPFSVLKTINRRPQYMSRRGSNCMPAPFHSTWDSSVFPCTAVYMFRTPLLLYTNRHDLIKSSVLIPVMFIANCNNAAKVFWNKKVLWMNHSIVTKALVEHNHTEPNWAKRQKTVCSQDYHFLNFTAMTDCRTDTSRTSPLPHSTDSYTAPSTQSAPRNFECCPYLRLCSSWSGHVCSAQRPLMSPYIITSLGSATITVRAIIVHSWWKKIASSECSSYPRCTKSLLIASKSRGATSI